MWKELIDLDIKCEKLTYFTAFNNFSVAIKKKVIEEIFIFLLTHAIFLIILKAVKQNYNFVDKLR